MKYTNEELVEHIKSGHYFSDARKWHYSKFLLPTLYYKGISILLILVSASAIYSGYTAYKLSKVEQVKYLHNMHNIFSSQMRSIHMPRASMESVLETVIKYSLANYVIQREKYDSKKVQDQTEFVKNNSSQEVFNQYKNYINEQNPISPINRYQTSANRDITIHNIVFDSSQNQAVILYRSIVKNNIYQIIEDMNWKAEITFSYDKINPYKTETQNVKYQIDSYKLTILSNNLIQ